MTGIIVTPFVRAPGFRIPIPIVREIELQGRKMQTLCKTAGRQDVPNDNTAEHPVLPYGTH